MFSSLLLTQAEFQTSMDNAIVNGLYFETMAIIEESLFLYPDIKKIM